MVRPQPVYRHHEVSSLAWMIYSCPLMEDVSGLQIFGESWCDEQFGIHRQWLDSLDEDPTPLLSWINTDAQKLLGKKFESLAAFWFAHSLHFELIHRNVLLRQGLNTSGEADMIVREKSTGEVWHVEVACKYYIQLNKSRRWADWTGPNAHDSLEEKMQKLKRQVNLFHTESGLEFLQNNHLPMPETYVLLKGYFFHHFSDLQGSKAPDHAHPHYHSGWYCSLEELSYFENTPEQWLPLPKEMWLGPYHFAFEDQVILNGRELREYCSAEIARTRKAVMIAQVISEGNMIREISRGFIIR